METLAKRAFLPTLLLALAARSTFAARQNSVWLVDKTWRIAIEPETLRVTATVPGGKQPIILSKAQLESLKTVNLQTTPDSAKWDVPSRHLTISMRLEGDELVVDITAQAVGDFTWPILSAQASIRAYILPLGEGVYAPAHDAGWSKYLADREGLSTTENLSLPLWGVAVGGHTLTYMLTNPFNNELTFRSESGSLASSLTHRFTKNWKVKTYGLRIGCSEVDQQGACHGTDGKGLFRRKLRRGRQKDRCAKVSIREARPPGHVCDLRLPDRRRRGRSSVVSVRRIGQDG